MTLLSQQMMKEVSDIIDARLNHILKASNIQQLFKDVKELKMKKQDAEEIISEFEDTLKELDIPSSELLQERFSSIEQDIDNLVESNFIKEENLEELVGITMLKLMPNFNLKISEEIKKHFVSLAEYVIKHFKEKD